MGIFNNLFERKQKRSGITFSTWTREEGNGRKPLVEYNPGKKIATNKKYKLLEKDAIKPYQLYPITLFRIEAKMTFGTVKKGDKGGYIQSEDNLSATGNAWVYDNACVEGNAKVSDNAQVYGSAKVSGSAQIYGNAKVYENAEVYGDAQIKDNAEVYGNAKVKGNALIYGNAKIHAKGWVGFNQKIGGNQEVVRDIMIDEMY